VAVVWQSSVGYVAVTVACTVAVELQLQWWWCDSGS
jgi:hypothetical protein